MSTDSRRRKSKWDIQQADLLHQSMTKALKFGELLKSFPRMVNECLTQQTWALRFCREKGREFESAIEYFTHNELDGVGTTAQTVELLIKDDFDTVDLWRKATVGAKNLHRRDNDNISIKPQQGTSRAYVVSRLRRDYPVLYEEVKAQRMSPYAASIEAGFRKKPASPFEQVKKLMPRLSAAEKRELRKLLEE